MSDERSADVPLRSRNRRASRDRTREELAALTGDEQAFVLYFKERVYATFTGLALVLVLVNAEHPTPERSFLVLALGVLGITAAGFIADIVSHLAVHRDFPDSTGWIVMLRIAGGALGTAIVPLVLIGLAWLNVMDLAVSLHAATVVYIATLGVIGWFAVRRSKLSWWKQLIALGALLLLGLAVIGLQTLAHSVGEH